MSFVADLRAVLRGRDFRRLFGTRLVSQFSDGIFQFAVYGYAFFTPENQTSAAEAAAAFAVLLLPYSILGPFVGVFIDRWSRRQILVIGPLVRGGLLALAAVLVATGAPDAYFYIAALGVLGVNRFFLAALGASLPHVVPADRLMMANSVTPTSGTVATFVGAGAGYLLRLLFGPTAQGTAMLLVVSGAVFGLSALVALTMERSLLGPSYDPNRPQAREALRNVLSGLVDGARHVTHRRTAVAALGSMAAHRFMYGISLVMTAILYRFYFSQGDAEVGLMQLSGVVATSGVGYFSAAFVTPWATARMRIETWVTTMLASAGILQFLLCFPFQEWGFLIGGFVLGLAGQSVKICADTVVQRDVEDAYLGRVFSIYDMLFNGMTVAAAAVSGLFLPADGKSYLALGIVTVGYLVAAAVYRLAMPTGERPRPNRAVHTS
ncbi:MFS transporter [Thermopolyspora sp. NPDC052614]|uniref:MFS transporter n=1 Tax=Thermopolyspora sp. NPDC052614 TaxID=3155682 RepID=UPI003419DDCC